MTRMLLTALLIFSGGILTSAGQCEAQTNYVTIGTGSVAGVYYPTGSAIAKTVNKKGKTYHLRVTVESTAGSVYNVNAIATGALEFGLVQSDRQFQAYNGTKDWAGKPVRKLRSLFSLHQESVTIIANAEKNIQSLMDLKNKVVNIGNPGSGQHGNAVDLLEAAGLDIAVDLQARTLKPLDAVRMLQAGKIDAMFYTVGHPSGAIREAMAGAVKTNFVKIPVALINQLTQKYSYYTAASIPVEDYPDIANKEPIPTFGVKATLCTSEEMAEDIVYAMTKEVFENLEEVKTLHPALRSLTRSTMLEGLSAPIHPGALRYYQEVGLM